ncbi:hypothetical protein GGQ80_001214 [Sphingomonas jinjuensis]|uniref:Tail specific protease domain-containing protein n=1 Tax=Sphingomonas jinjuensis TaxID=535907 RepID=A0A840F9L5_9SPHN|nr:S41 family peptidase [Sphingomonas jinjuensis]MBB4153312.1 hypothetical protein [Sphingomonas jinjuensis]
MTWMMMLALAAAADAEPAVPSMPAAWQAATLGDLRAFHASIAANHAGSVNRLDPGFNAREAAALALAEQRAAQVRDFPGYLATLRGYAASFDDGHVQIGFADKLALPLRWPGFLTGFDGAGRQLVRTRADDAPVPLGARLVDCDGRPAARLAEEVVGGFRGRWSLSSQRMLTGGRLFVDAGNPFVKRPARCRFDVGGMVRSVTLAWRPLPDAEFDTRLNATAPRVRPLIGARVLADGTRWFAMSSFDGDPASDTAKALRPLIAGMTSDRAGIATAPAVVLDLRGNGGGSSDWAHQIADVLWGKAAVEALPDRSEGVDWRASPANLATLEGYRRQFAAPDASPDARRWAEKVATGIGTAVKAGRPLWREVDEPEPAAKAAATVPAPPPVKGPIYVLTDWGCGSACLDAVDLWKALGAVQIGQETSADTLYMDIRQDQLPSRLATIAVPMKVYRGRERGSNVPQVPAHRYTGDMTDAAALEAWVATLPGKETRG